MRVHETPLSNKAKLISNSLELSNLEGVQYAIIENMLSIPANAFLNCKDLKKIILPEGLEEIQHDAFNGCKNLEFRLPSSLKFLGMRAFAGVKSNCNLIIPPMLSNVQIDCFMYTRFNRVVISEGMHQLGDIFRGAHINKLIIPRSLEYLTSANIDACDEVVCYADTLIEDYCKKYFRRKISIRGGMPNAEFK